MKKLLAVVLTGAFVVSALAGCGKSTSADDKVIKVRLPQHLMQRFLSRQSLYWRQRVTTFR